MCIRVRKIQKPGNGFSLWISTDKPFGTEHFLEIIAEVDVRKKERILESFGPAEIIDEYHTEHGVFGIHYEYDEYAGTTIYSRHIKLMNQIWNLMLQSGHFQEKR